MLVEYKGVTTSKACQTYPVFEPCKPREALVDADERLVGPRPLAGRIGVPDALTGCGEDWSGTARFFDAD